MNIPQSARPAGLTPSFKFHFLSNPVVKENRPSGRTEGCAWNKRQKHHGASKVVLGIFHTLSLLWMLAYAAIVITWLDDQIQFSRAMESSR